MASLPEASWTRPVQPRRTRPWPWWRWVGWVVANRALTRHHLLSYLRMARAVRGTPGLVFEGPCFVGPDVEFEVSPGFGRLFVGAFCHFGHGSRLRAHEGTLRIGRKSVIGIRNTVNCWIDVEIGEAALFADDVYVCDFDHKFDDLGVPIKDQGIVKSPVRIGGGTWVGTKTIITRGTDIGPGSVVAAGAVARGSYPAGAVIAGVPGRVVRLRGADE